jgi:hypothetical protein
MLEEVLRLRETPSHSLLNARRYVSLVLPENPEHFLILLRGKLLIG